MKRAKQRQMFARGGAAAISLAVIAAVGIAAVTALRSRPRTTSVAPAAPDAADSLPSTAADTADTTGSIAPSAMLTVAPTVMAAVPTSLGEGSSPAGPAVATVVAETSARQLALVVPVGRSALRDTMVAERAGDTVQVSFDLTLSRTRRPDKFEAIMRSTLPQVYGAAADSALRALPEGAVARAGDLIATLPERGIRIPLAGGRAIAVWPVTREGRDGPLVVAYRAVASR